MFSMLLLSPKKWQGFDFWFVLIDANTNFHRVKEALALILSISKDLV